jgi:hypothetical protein
MVLIVGEIEGFELDDCVQMVVNSWPRDIPIASDRIFRFEFLGKSGARAIHTFEGESLSQSRILELPVTGGIPAISHVIIVV